MVKLIGEIVLTSVMGSLGVPIIMLALAKVGYFPPVSFQALGKTWKFGTRAVLQLSVVVMLPQRPTTRIGTVKLYSQPPAALVAIDQQPVIVETTANSANFELRAPPNSAVGFAA
jgi:hypothetical protein